MTHRILVTGAHSETGRCVINSLSLDQGKQIAALVSPWSNNSDSLAFSSNVQLITQDLQKPFSNEVSELLPKCDFIIHLAWVRAASRKTAEGKNIDIVRRLTAPLKSPKCFLFMSSVAQAARNSSSYGQAKWLVEKYISNLGGYVFVCGLVQTLPPYGPDALLRNTIKKIPFTPKFILPNIPIFVTPMTTIETAVNCFVLGEELPHVSRLYKSTPTDLNDLVDEVKESKKFLVPVPVGLIVLMSKIMRVIPISISKRFADKLLTFCNKGDISYLTKIPYFNEKHGEGV